MNEFPFIAFGKCQICGMDGDDDPTASGADSSSNISAGNGIELILYQGKYMCDVCKNRLIADEESKRIAANIAQDEKFRQRAGFVKTIT